MSKDFTISQFVVAIASVLTAMEASVSTPVILIWATVGVALFGELFWKYLPQLKNRRWAGIIGIAVIVYSLTFSQFIRPTILVEAGDIQMDRQMGDIWIRVALRNRGWQEVTCRFFLNVLKKNGMDHPIWSGNPLPLWPAGNEIGEGLYDRTIPPDNLNHFFNIAYIRRGKDKLSIPSEQFGRQVSYALEPGTYKFSVKAAHGACQSAQTDVWLRYDGGTKVSFVDGR